MIKFERSLSHSYVIFVDEEKRADELSINMLRENKIEGLLPIKVSMLNSVAEVAYEISGYTNMKKLLEGARINHEQIINLLETIQKLSDSLEGYYLEPEYLILEPKYIYCNEDLKETLFCYDITTESSGQKGLLSLSELILEAADFYDYKSVVYAYELRQAIKAENFSLTNIIEKLKTVGTFPVYNNVSKPAIVADNQLCFEKEDNKESEEVKEVFVETKNEINDYVKKEMAELSDLPDEDWENEEPSGKLFGFSKRKKNKKEKNRKCCNTEDLDIMEESFFHVGKVDSPGENKIFEPKRYEISSVNSVVDNLIVENYPFLIGSLQHAVDGCISDPDISRFHARFDQNMGKVYLSDLNSVSGTFLNGERLKGSVQKEIKIGDKIKFGHLDFVVT